MSRQPGGGPMNDNDEMPGRQSAAANWAPLVRFIAADEWIAHWAGKQPATAFLYEFVRFGLKQGWACLFGGAMVGLLIATSLWYPRNAPLARYDFLFLAALVIQIAMLTFRLETFEEAKVILIFHIVGTLMEVGIGHRTPDSMRDLMLSRDRKAAGRPEAPVTPRAARGLPRGARSCR